jgi:type III pantothenate kinase
MNIVVDYGNTTAKVGIFADGRLVNRRFFLDTHALRSFLVDQAATHILVSSVSFSADEILSWVSPSGKKLALTARLPLPIKIRYKTPETLGVDRLAAVCGALELFPTRNCLVIDAGTCITYEFLDNRGNYHGGAISPGVAMRFEAMHTFTARLPRVAPSSPAPLIGDSTETGLQSGVLNGIAAELTGIIARYYGLYPDIQVLMCGGDAAIFEKQVNQPIFADLVLTGLNRILTHNLRP